VSFEVLHHVRTNWHNLGVKILTDVSKLLLDHDAR